MNKYANTLATIRSNGSDRFYISLDNGTCRLRQDYKTPATAARIAKNKGYRVVIDPGSEAYHSM